MSKLYDIAIKSPPFQVRSNTYHLLVLKVLDPMAPGFFARLRDQIEQAPHLFKDAPLVLDLNELPSNLSGFTLTGFVTRLRQLGLIAIGVQGGEHRYQDAAQAIGLANMPPSHSNDVTSPIPLAKPATIKQPTVVKHVPTTNHVVLDPVRSGREIQALNSNVVIISTVNPGAEVIAGGDIHIYGSLHGRAIAGFNGNTDAHIFCQSMEAEMISIAGLYRCNEDIDPSLYGKRVHAYLHKGYLYMDCF